jgi:hypothetical protein
VSKSEGRIMDFGDREPSNGTKILNMGAMVQCDNESSCKVPIL